MKYLKLYESFKDIRDANADLEYHKQIIKDVFQNTMDDNNIETAHDNTQIINGIYCYIAKGFNPLKITVLFAAREKEHVDNLSKIKSEIEEDLNRLESMGYKISQRYYSPYNGIESSFQYEIDYSQA